MSKSQVDKTVLLFWVSLVGGFASVCAFATSMVFPGDRQTQYVAYSSVVYIIVLLSIQVYMLLERGRTVHTRDQALQQLHKLQSYKDSYQALHGISHAVRDCLHERLTNGAARLQRPDHRQFCLVILDNLKEIFRSITGVRCATCIKVYFEEDGTMITLGRDGVSAADRGLIDQGRVSGVDSNTASQRIVRDKDRHFFCNDLEKLADNDGYKSDRPMWQHHYRSTIVWPIRHYDPETNAADTFGVLCVDSPATNVFERTVSLQIGACVADMLYPYFCRFSLDELFPERRRKEEDEPGDQAGRQ